MTTQLDKDLIQIKAESANFTHLNSFLNWTSIEKQAKRKYPSDISSTLASNKWATL
jgi:hypothetical protein